MLSKTAALALAFTTTPSILRHAYVCALPTDHIRPSDANYVPTAPPGCTFVSTVTYADRWGPIFVEDDFECDFPPLNDLHNSLESFSISNDADEEEQGVTFSTNNHRTLLTPLSPHTTDYHLTQTQQTLSSRATSPLPAQLEKHQITSYGCASLPNPAPLDPTKGASLLWSITQLTNQSCLLPGHMKQYREIPREWSPDWAFSNMNRGDQVICDWYPELANIASALHFYCEHSLERVKIPNGDGGGDVSGEVLAYGRDKEREGQFWCMRYTKRGPGEKVFEEKCLGL